FTEACGRLGLSDPVTVHTDYTGEDGARATRRLLSAPDRPTAIVYDNDIMAVAGLSVAQEMRLDVPADLSIVAWDDSPLSQVVRPSLTAVTRDIPAGGAHATRALLRLIETGETGSLEGPPASLLPRGSTAPAGKLASPAL
ncbi:MAG TPA: substrate-binding domain-containing protein, partial [Chloroflexota bacterium]|nr:substrate-binding domain-containing protein [Chloroflexota bacterium]